MNGNDAEASVWLIVLNWNGKEDTLALLDTLATAQLSQTTVLVVDNGSCDGTLEAVSDRYPWVRLLQNGANLGYAEGNNRGIQLALSEAADYICVLNNDTLVTPNFLPPMVQLASDRRSAVSPDIRYAADTDISWFFGTALDSRAGSVRHLQPTEQPDRAGPHDSPTLTGCCLVAHADVWRLVGSFDEKFFLIFEDSDWSMRARVAGVHLRLQPLSIVHHKVSRSFAASPSGLGIYYYCRNGVLFAWRWLGVKATARFIMRSILIPTARELGQTNALRAATLRLLALIGASTGRGGRATPVVINLSNFEEHRSIHGT